MDKITLQRIDLLHPIIREEVSEIYKLICQKLSGKAICRFAYTLRTFKEQDELYSQGRTKLFDSAGKRLGIVTKAKGGQSIHNYGLAIDIVLLVDKNGDGVYESASWETKVDYDGDAQSDWMEIVSIFKAHGYIWGGDWKFKDAPHFEKNGYSWKDLLEKYNKKDFIPGSTYVNL